MCYSVVYILHKSQYTAMLLHSSIGIGLGIGIASRYTPILLDIGCLVWYRYHSHTSFAFCTQHMLIYAKFLIKQRLLNTCI